MKIRADFVTNSSSSSYIIAYKSFPVVDDETTSKYPWVAVIADRMFEFISENREEAIMITDVEDLDDYIVSEYGWGLNKVHKDVEDVLEYEGEYLQQMYKKVVDSLNEGFKIMIKGVPYSDHLTEELLRALTADKDNFRIIDDFEE